MANRFPNAPCSPFLRDPAHDFGITGRKLEQGVFVVISEEFPRIGWPSSINQNDKVILILLLYIMTKIIFETENLKLFLPEIDQAELALDYFNRNKDHLNPTNPVLPQDFFTNSFWKKRLDQNLSEYNNDQSVRLFIEHNQNKNQFIGVVNFTQITRGPFQACYLGYSIDKEFQGRGLMFEALISAIKNIFDVKHIHRIMANYLLENQRSEQLLKRLEFKIDGTSPDYIFIHGKWRTHVLTSLTNQNWTPREEDKILFLNH